MRWTFAVVAAVAALLGSSTAYGRAGDVDRTWAHDGIASVFPPSGNTFHHIGMSLSNSGRPLIAGHSSVFPTAAAPSPPTRFAAALLASDGSMDATFGTSGLAIAPGPGGDAAAADKALRLADSRTILVGTNGFIVQVARLTTAGTLDTSYATNGFLSFAPDMLGPICGALPASGGKLVVVGVSRPRVFLTRITSDGKIDGTFAPGGFRYVSLGGAVDRCGEAVAAPGGKILITSGTGVGSSRRAVVARVTSQGLLDTTFGSGGKVRMVLSGSEETFTGAAPVSGGKLLVLAGVGARAARSQVFRLRSDGSRDTTFSRDGASGTYSLEPSNLVADGRGRALFADTGGSVGTRVRVARMSTSGVLDSAFGAGGIAMVPFLSPEMAGDEIRIDSSGRIYLLVGAGDEGLLSPYVVRFRG